MSSVGGFSRQTVRRAATSSNCQRRRYVRHLHWSSAHRQLVGPPDAVSHLRPVIYDNRPSSYLVQHPYSLREFRDLEEQNNEHENDFGNYELKLRMAQLDVFNHDFWTEVSFGLSFNVYCTLTSLFRLTLDLNQPKRLSWMHYLCPQVQRTVKKRSPTSIDIGW
jgi:hypothetical protein